MRLTTYLPGNQDTGTYVFIPSYDEAPCTIHVNNIKRRCDLKYK